MGGDERGLDAQTRSELHAALAAEHRRAREREASLTRQFEAIVDATAEANTDDEHDPEGATIGFERAQVSALREEARRRMGELAAAMERLAAESYGRCERCTATIARERLLARPDTRWCRRCAD